MANSNRAASAATPPTSADIKAYLATIRDLADTIRDLGSIPSGHLYARLMEYVDLETYDSIIAILISADLVRRDPSHLLVWIGGAK